MAPPAKRLAELPPEVRGVYSAWERCREGELDDALSRINGFFKPPGRFSTKQKCRNLTLLRSPLPSSITSVVPLSEEGVSAFVGHEVTPTTKQRDFDMDSVHSSPSEDHMTSMESNLAKCLETIARQNEQLDRQAATLERLFEAQADPDEVQTSTYEVTDSVIKKTGAKRRR